LLATIELAVVLQPFRFDLWDPQAFLQREAGSLTDFRRAAVIADDGVLLANFGPVLDVTQPGGYGNLFSNSYANLVTGSDAPVIVDVDRADNPALALLGYEAILEPDKAAVTLIQPPPPQVWVAHCAWPGGALEVRAQSFPRFSCVTLASVQQPDPVVPRDPAELIADEQGQLTIEADGPGWLVTVQPWYPGWSATIDGATAPVELIDGALVGVQMACGHHRVTLSYFPGGLQLGAVVSASSGVVLVLWWLRATRRRAQLPT
jgi:hypothetical protein